MMTTKTTRGAMQSRPMSNNGDVKYDGNSYFFTYEDSQKVKDLKKDASVNLSFEAKGGMFINVMGKGRLITSKTIMQEHWLPSLKQWFKDGIDTEGIVMIVVKATRIKYWYKMEMGEVKVS